MLRISTASSPTLLAARTALSGGPLLIKAGQRQKIQSTPDAAYEVSSMLERHPRSAIGWNAKQFFLIQVDGRQKNSEGMTLDELAHYLFQIGCHEAINLDGGGSSTLWCNGAVVNHPCDGGKERPIANALVAVRKRIEAANR